MRRVPALVRFGVPLDRTRATIHELASKAPCPEPLRDLLATQLAATFEVGLVRALWTPDWRTCAQLAVDALVRAGGLESPERAIERIVEITAAGPRGRYGTPQIVREKTLADVIALVDRGLDEEAARVARGLRAHDQPYARAHLGRLALRVAPVRERSIRAGAHLLVAREAIARGHLDLARVTADAIEPSLIRQYAYVELARELSLRGHVVDALRLLHAVTRDDVAYERELLRVEIRLMVRRDRVEGVRRGGTTWEPPAWLKPRGWISTEHRHDRWIVSAFLRSGLLRNDRWWFEHATRMVRWVSPAALFDILPRVGVDIDEALDALRDARTIDQLRVERMAMRADELARTTRELPEPMRLGLAGLATHDNNDGRSLERAWFDEGVALSTSASRRRRVLIGVAQSALRSARSQSPEVLRSRLRTLVHLGGSLAADAIATPLEQLPIDKPSWLAGLESLCALDPSRATDVVLGRLTDLRRADIEPSSALDLVVATGGMTRERASAFAGFVRMLDTAHGDRAQRWFAEFSRLWVASTGSSLDDNCLAWLQTCDLQRDPHVLLEELAAHVASLLDGDAREVAERLSTDARGLRAILLAGPRVDPRMTPWKLDDWKSLLAKAATRTYSVNPSTLRHCARLLGRPHGVHALAAGDLSALGVIRSIVLTANGKRYRLLLLDHRRDILTFLRFADVPARSCFRSDSALYDCECHTTRDQIIAAWRDPLTLCFRVEREHQRAFTPCGFLFGSFADVDGKAAVLFNSLHVRPNNAEVREQVLRAVERSLHALNLRYIAVANSHGGRGHLPGDYTRAERDVTRLRALSRKENPVTSIQDDISVKVNEPMRTYLYWRELSGRSSARGRAS